jgi:hypothetical protein
MRLKSQAPTRRRDPEIDGDCIISDRRREHVSSSSAACAPSSFF